MSLQKDECESKDRIRKLRLKLNKGSIYDEFKPIASPANIIGNRYLK